jgi:hypothetical protein
MVHKQFTVNEPSPDVGGQLAQVVAEYLFERSATRVITHEHASTIFAFF